MNYAQDREFKTFLHRISGRYSNQSGSRYSYRWPPRNKAPPSIDGSYVKYGIKPSLQQYQMNRLLANSQVVLEANDTIRDYLRGGQRPRHLLLLHVSRGLSQTLHNIYLTKAEPIPRRSSMAVPTFTLIWIVSTHPIKNVLSLWCF
jgi:hypothetical protein